MDPGSALDTLTGPGMGAALVGCVWALAKAIRARSEGAAAKDVAEAASESAAAKAVTELVVQLGQMRADLSRETAARMALEGRVQALQDDLARETSTRMHLEGQIHVLTLEVTKERQARQSAEGWAHSLANELAELRRALTSGHTKLTLPPPWGSGEG
jgi:chromosome segregation ATPase